MTAPKIPPIICTILWMAMSFCVSAQQNKSSHKRAIITKDFPTLQYGVASFYHNKFEGRQTANGDIFTQKKLTAASNTLPLNCWVKVTNLYNKRSVILRITDRMHMLNKRLIDLSRSAASKLGYTGIGLTRVKVVYLGFAKPLEDDEAKSNN